MREYSAAPGLFPGRSSASGCHQPLKKATQFLANTVPLLPAKPVDGPAPSLEKELGADGGGRTHTSLRIPDFESSASANSATSARCRHKIYRAWDGVNRFCCRAGLVPI